MIRFLSVGTIATVLAATVLATTGCATTPLQVPKDTGSFEQRRAAYRALKITEYGTNEETTVMTNLLFMAQFTDVTPSVRLANGTLVKSPLTLRYLVNGDSRTAQFMDVFEAEQSNVDKAGLVGLGSLLLGVGVMSVSRIPDAPSAGKSFFGFKQPATYVAFSAHEASDGHSEVGGQG